MGYVFVRGNGEVLATGHVGWLHRFVAFGEVFHGP